MTMYNEKSIKRQTVCSDKTFKQDNTVQYTVYIETS